jgi:DNA-binding transcriptional MerR regulator
LCYTFLLVSPVPRHCEGSLTNYSVRPIIEKKYYTIGEVANTFGVTTSLIRYWEKYFKQLRPQTSKQGVRRYTSEDIQQFKQIYQLIKEQGYTIKGAQETLKGRVPSPSSKEIIANLKSIKEFLQNLREQV